MVIGVVRVLAAGLVVLGAATATASAQSVEPEADKILHSMSDYMAKLKSFSVEYETENEVVDLNGQKLQYSAAGTVAVERPSKLHMTRKGSFADAEVFFDGKTISLYGKRLNSYAQFPSPGPGIDDAIEEVRTSTGIDAPGSDLVSSDPYALLSAEATSGFVVGTAIIGGIESDHIAFRNPSVDWQMWIQKGAQPLPLKYVITTKWVTGAPQYTIRFSKWNVAPTIDAKLFDFVPPTGAKKIETVQVDVIGEITEDTEH